MTEQDLFEILKKFSKLVEELEARIKEQDAEIVRLKKKIEESERKNAKYVAPFSRDQRKAHPRKAGRRAGEGVFAYKLPPEPDHIHHSVNVEPPNHCPFCTTDLTGLKLRIDKAFVTELPKEFPKQTVQYNVPVVVCPKCGRTVRGQHPDLAPDQFGATAHRFGPRLLALTQLLRHFHNTSERHASGIIWNTTGIRITQSTINQAAMRVARPGTPLDTMIEEIKAEIATAERVHHDDTGWRWNRTQAWIGGYVTAKSVYFTANERHTHAELKAVLGDHFEGVLISDRFAVYRHRDFLNIRQQKCLSHLIRNADEATVRQQGKRGRGHEYSAKIAAIFRDALRTYHAFHDGLISQAVYDHLGLALIQRLEKLLERPPLKSKINETLRQGLLKEHRLGRIFLFLKHPEIPPTNNVVERALRSPVMGRKVSQCSKTKLGAQTYTRIKSVIETTRLRGGEPLEVLTTLNARPRPG